MFGAKAPIFRTMKQVSIGELKRGLSHFLAQAQAGERYLILRHRRVIATLGPGQESGTRRGARFGAPRLTPAFKSDLGSRARELLDDDRNGGAPGTSTSLGAASRA